MSFVTKDIGGFTLKIAQKHLDIFEQSPIHACSAYLGKKKIVAPVGRYYCLTQKKMIQRRIGRAIAIDEHLIELNDTQNVTLHKDGDHFNCLLENLDVKPVCFAGFIGSNTNNKTGFRGVYFDPEKNKYRAIISFMGRSIRLGRYTSPEKAFEAYKAKALELYGDYALQVIDAS